ncbi:hypothetical protein V5E97_06825 [Singulisphaera sp. Ch08]|uniref:Uncharacterized protein n=1 Tax=Singulisphaera sp. Ch08 TaxID=3120278 RepID=A0AAU7CLB1_9BACT
MTTEATEADEIVIPDCPPITTKAEFAECTDMLQLLLFTIGTAKKAGTSPERDLRKADIIAGKLRDALKAAPFVVGDQAIKSNLDYNNIVDATPETKAAENALIDNAFVMIGELAGIPEAAGATS